ncbi:MAG: hypothetical protein HXY46_12110 [Syntrophaceae bacterium]|nr:hypothetical protein [Syntrophaceae bacterium]
MKKRAGLSVVTCVVAICLVAIIPIASGQEQPKVKTPVATEKLIKPLPLPDLIVLDIYGTACPNCGCGRTNFQNHPLVEYQEDIWVRVRNQGRGASDSCTLKIELYDVIGGRMAVINKSVPKLQPGGEYMAEERGEFLYRKSSGIKATIDSTNAVAELNEANNTKTVTECAPKPPI